MAPYEELQESIIAGDNEKVKEVVRALVEKGNDPLEIISDGFMPGMSVVGHKMKTGEMFIPEVLMSAQAMGVGMELLKPLITGEFFVCFSKYLGGSLLNLTQPTSPAQSCSAIFIRLTSAD